MASQKRWGLLDPISVAPPTEEDRAATELLDGLLHEYNLYESEIASVKRERILNSLYRICKEWVESVMEKRGFTRSVTKNAGVKICTSGSYRLGVHGPGSDIDTLCVAPSPVTLDDFFESLYKILEANRDVTELTKVPGAHVPVMKMEFSGISIDLLFVSLPLLTIPTDLDLLSEENLKGMDDRSVRAMNGCRVSDALLKLVPNIPNFRLTLRCIKLWATRRGIYGNAVGFPGGVAWAILTAQLCQLYPNALPSTLVSRFFRVFAAWRWPAPVLITEIVDLNLGHRIWNPMQYRQDGAHLMPIITPVYPCMNTTFNITRSTQSIIQSELERGQRITARIDEPGAFRDVAIWTNLFEPVDFFGLYDRYLQVQASGATDIETRTWSGWIQSRLRHLVGLLERVPGLRGAHPQADGYDHKEPGAEGLKLSFFLGLMLDTPPKDPAAPRPQLDISQAVSDFKLMYINNFENKTATMDCTIRVCTRKSLPAFLGLKRKKRSRSSASKSSSSSSSAAPASTSDPPANTSDQPTTDAASASTQPALDAATQPTSDEPSSSSVSEVAPALDSAPSSFPDDSCSAASLSETNTDNSPAKRQRSQ